MEYTLLKAEEHVDMEAECLYRYVYGSKDWFNLHCHEFYEIFITVSGTVAHRINGVTQLLPEGSLVFIRPNDIHGFIYENTKNAETEFVNLTFTLQTADLLFKYLTNDFPSEYLLNCPMPPMVILNGIEKKRLLTQIGELNSVVWKDKKALKLRMRAILAEIFTRHFAKTENYEETNIPLWLSKLIYKMEQPENFVAGLDRMVDLSKKSREHLSRSLKTYYGLTITEYINSLRINFAANLLTNTDIPIIDICFNCGYQNTSYFYKIFREKYNMSPGEFRNQYKLIKIQKP